MSRHSEKIRLFKKRTDAKTPSLLRRQYCTVQGRNIQRVLWCVFQPTSWGLLFTVQQLGRAIAAGILAVGAATVRQQGGQAEVDLEGISIECNDTLMSCSTFGTPICCRCGDNPCHLDVCTSATRPATVAHHPRPEWRACIRSNAAVDADAESRGSY
ncbi:hypothetical protein BCV70DRAFT_95667 [Testicularia cyperi]|uniref:Uncharacterized protein n=1 Tax=Testicularia cyperi TaxID=1882483 RepID=A0A317XSW6_9BASI|nr:hypothetical protein BCV70DRAFT_95667 [Testicularia cyperi]